MALRTSVDTAMEIIVDYSPEKPQTVETFGVRSIGEGTSYMLQRLKRTRTVARQRSQWVALTYSAAKAYADANTDSNNEYTVSEDARYVGSYILERRQTVFGAWTAIYSET